MSNDAAPRCNATVFVPDMIGSCSPGERGGGGFLALEMGRGVPPACSKPDPVAIRLMAQKTPCSNFEINTEFDLFVYGEITDILYV